MNKTLVRLSLVALAAGSIGCAQTDGAVTQFRLGDEPMMNSHTIINNDDSRIANAQQTSEREAQGLLVARDVGTTFRCVQPPGSPTISAADAKDWRRFLGPWQFLGEAVIFGAGSPTGYGGTYSLSGTTDLADGSSRTGITDGREDQAFIAYHDDGYISGPLFTSIGASENGRYGGPDGLVVGNGLPGGRIPGLHADAVTIDGAAAIEWGNNLMACHPDRAAASSIPVMFGYDFCTYWAALARFGEGRVAKMPTPRSTEGLAEFLSGQPMTVNFDGIQITGKGNLLNDGRWELHLLGLAADGVAPYVAETPVRLVASPKNNFRTWEVHPVPAELVNMARFAIEAGVTDRQITLDGKVVPELGIALPPLAVLLSGDAFRAFIEAQTGGVDGG